MRFSAEQAFEAQQDGDPIMIDMEFAKQLVSKHGVNLSDMIAELGTHETYDAANILGWLGY